MKKFFEIKPEEFGKNPFQLIGREWMLVTAGDADKENTMTASWGGLGVMWGKNVAFIVLRPQRYTKEFVDRLENFSLSFLDSSYKKQLSYLGGVSGRDEDKIAKSGLTLQHSEKAPYFEESNTVIICKKLYAQAYQPECFKVEGLDSEWYPKKDYHTLYVAEIEKILIKQ
jgi:flavin reductase (DIM6/NTAB) family NADH-FMN oxidoreductase RutF